MEKVRGDFMILTDKEIRNLCKFNGKHADSRNLIYPFSEDALQSESYDISIGDRIRVLNEEIRCLSLDDQDSLDNMYIERKLDKEGYLIAPKKYILVSVKERINLPDCITAHVRPRTKFTRAGLLLSPQHCNSTYSGYLQLGLLNASDYPIRIFPGLKFGQIVFEELKSVPSEDKLYKNKKNASYQNEECFLGPKFDNEFKKEVTELVNLILKKD